MTLTQAEEDRHLKQFERACYRAAHRTDINGMSLEDKAQEGRIAALIAIRLFNPNHSSCKLSSFVIEGIERRLWSLQWQHRKRKRETTKKPTGNPGKIRDTDCDSLDFATGEDGVDTLADRLPSPDTADGNLLLMACESLCQSDTELAIVNAIWVGESMNSLGKSIGLSRERMRQLKESLFARVRSEISL